MKNLNILIVLLLFFNLTLSCSTKKRATCEAYHTGNPNAYKKYKSYNRR